VLALLDAELLAQLYVELQGGRQIGLELAADAPGGAYGGMIEETVAVTSSVTRTFRSPRPHAASAEELARHAEFMAGFSEPIWSR
jgi:DNA polymerase-3 subunit epsilon